MIDQQQLRRVQDALQKATTVQLTADAWTSVQTIVRRITRAIHTGDEAELADAVADLAQITATAGQGELSRRRGIPRGGYESRGSGRPRGPFDRPREVERSGAGSMAPGDVTADIAQATRALEADATRIECTPHIDIGSDTPVSPSQTFNVEVYLDTNPSRPGESAEPFVLDRWPSEHDELLIDVWLTGTAHFEINRPTIGTITLVKGAQNSDRAVFTVSVRDPLPLDAGEPALCARFDFRMLASGSVRRTVPITGVSAVSHFSTPKPASDTTPSVALDKRAAADVEVSVAHIPGTNDSYKVVVKTGLDGGAKIEDEWSLKGGSEAYVKEMMAEFMAEGASSKSRTRSLEGAGVEFFDASPAEFQRLYWRLVDAGTPPRTMSIISEERHVPWELMIPSRDGPNGYERRDALGVTCAIGRWHGRTDDDDVDDPVVDAYRVPGQLIPLTDSLVLAPEYATKKLPSAAAERDLVLRMFPGQNVPATFDELDEFYAGHRASLLHFACHGQDETLQAILLLNRQTLSALQVRTGGLGDSCRASRPLVFLNACEVGRPGVGLVAVGGFTASFIKCHASAIIAPLWSVDDQVAHEVAVTFYEAVIAEPATPFADILRKLRANAYGKGGRDSFAAYSFYGNPWASARQP